MPDDALFVQVVDVLDVFPVHGPVPVFHGINVMDHAQVDIVGAKPPQQVLKRRADVGHVPCTDVLAVLPGGAQVPLHVPLLPAALHGLADDIPGFRVRHPAVHNVHAPVVGVPQQRHGVFLLVAFQPFPAETDLADGKACFTEYPILHQSFPPSVCAKANGYQLVV